MIINKDLRKLVASRIFDKLNKELRLCNPYGFKDCQSIYENLCYWEDLLETL